MGNPYHDSELWRRVREARERWELACEQCAKAENTFSVVVLGEQNSGKSTLCNALVKDWQNITFPVSDVRETTESDEVQHSGSGMTIVDTPGFGTIFEKDTSELKRELYRANLLLFVHSLKAGELQGQEDTMLEVLRDEFPDIRERLLVVGSKLGEVPDGAEEILAEVKRQVGDILWHDIEVVALDSKDYQEGMAEDDADLVEYSRFGALLQWLEAHRNTPSMSQKILKTAAQDYENALTSVQSNAERTLEDLGSDRNRYRESLQVCWSDNRSGIQRSWDKCARYSR